jgi:hypothetical protein
VPLIPGVRPAVRVYPDISLDGALKRLGTASILAVVSRANPWLLLGTLTLEDVLRAYGVAQEPGSQPEAEPPAEERG